MNNQIILPKSDIMLSSSREVLQHTERLKPFGVTMFSYTRVYEDGSFIDVSDRPDMIDYFYYKTDIYKHYAPDANPSAIGEGCFILTSAEIANSPLAPVRDELNLDNSLSIIKKDVNFYEVWNYASSKNNHAIINYYINHLNFLHAFSFSFKEEMKSLIQKYENDKIWRPDILQDVHCVNEHKFKLTSRQLQCARLVLQGYSYKQIAGRLSLSKRTIESYILHMKSKLSCRNKAELIAKLYAIFS